MSIYSYFPLTIKYILDKLADSFETRSYFHNTKKQLKGVTFYFGQPDIDQRMIYIMEENMFQRFPLDASEAVCIVVASTEAAVVPNGEVIYVLTEDWRRVFDTVQRAIHEAEDWRQRLLGELNGECSLVHMCRDTINFLGNPVWIHDRAMNIIAMPRYVYGMTEMTWDGEAKELMVPRWKLEKLAGDISYQKTWTMKGPCMWYPKGQSHRTIFINIIINDENFGRILVNEFYSPFLPSTFDMVEYFCEVVKEAQKKNCFHNWYQRQVEILIEKIYFGMDPVEMELSRLAEKLGWGDTDQFCCIQYRIDKQEGKEMTPEAICGVLPSVLPHSAAFVVKNRIYGLWNLTAGLIPGQSPLQQARTAVNSNIVHLGISNIFSGLDELGYYFRQTDYAIESIRDESGSAGFEDAVLHVILSHFSSEMSIQSVISRKVLALDEYDRLNEVDFVDTLRVFLENNCQQSAAAEALFVHRTTLKYRLERISQIIGEDITDLTPQNRLYLWISALLLQGRF